MNRVVYDILKKDESFAVDSYTYPLNTTMSFAHCHEYYEILYLIRGERKLIVNDYASYTLCENAIAVIPPNCMHRTESVGSEYQTRILLAISKDLVDEIVKSTSENLLLCSRVLVTDLDDKYETEVKRILSLLLMLNKEDMFYEEYVKVLNSLLFLTLSESVSKNCPDDKIISIPNSSTSETIKSIIVYLQENAQEKTSLDEISEKFHMQKNYLARCFKKYTGTTITDYVNNIRLMRVQQFLVDGNISISDIASITGFNSRAYLERVFKKKFGVSPKKFQIEMRNKENKTEE